MKLKKRNQNKKKILGFRVTEAEYNKIKIKANLYCDGTISNWLVNAALNYKPNRNDFEN